MKPRTGRNDPCPCGSGKKYKKCCLPEDRKKPEPDSPRDASPSPPEPAPPAPETGEEITITAGAQQIGELGFLSCICLGVSRQSGQTDEAGTLVDPDKLYATRDAAERKGENQIGGMSQKVPAAAREEIRESLRDLGYMPIRHMEKDCADFQAELPSSGDGPRPRCGLCGNLIGLTKTMCCDEWICDDEGDYVVFSYARNSCYRNHRRYTLCGLHHAERHDGDWQDCQQCREDVLKTEMYVWRGTNEYNFEKLDDPPDFEPTHCAECGQRINFGEGGFSFNGDSYKCDECTSFPELG
ncbi:MAG: SEC-C metal-binding domain-containing protein [Candidatus Brocadiia bacterium]